MKPETGLLSSQMTFCDRCGKTATLRVMEAGVEQWTCAGCAGVISGTQTPHKVAEFFVRPRRRDGKCPYCQATVESALESGLVGCPLCYVAFEEELARSLGIRKGTWSRAEGW